MQKFENISCFSSWNNIIFVINDISNMKKSRLWYNIYNQIIFICPSLFLRRTERRLNFSCIFEDKYVYNNSFLTHGKLNFDDKLPHILFHMLSQKMVYGDFFSYQCRRKVIYCTYTISRFSMHRCWSVSWRKIKKMKFDWNMALKCK